MKLSTADNKIPRPSSSPRIGDFIAVGVIVVIVALLLVATNLSHGESEVLYAEIRTYGGEAEVARYPLGEDAEIEIENLGYHFTVAVSDGAVSVKHADCPDKVCVNSHAVSKANSYVICVPGGLVVKVISEREADAQSEEYDYVVH